MPVYSLRELNQHIRDTIEEAYPDNLWVRAEIVSCHVNPHSGHCYLELADSSAGAVAKIRGMVWKNTWAPLAERFVKESGRDLEAGMQVQVLVKVEFSPQYGMGLTIRDIDPAYTVGDLAVRRALTLNQLRKEGLLEKNKQLFQPFPAARFALISSPSAAGYGDFIKHLNENPFGFGYQLRLFPALMQGMDAIPSLLQAIGEINRQAEDFDYLILLRGGGGKMDLQVFDSFELAAALAGSRIPVLTGIGHERDESVCDQIAWKSFKTPTAVADFLIGQSNEAENEVYRQLTRISSSLQRAVRQREMELEQGLNQISRALYQECTGMENRLTQTQNRLVQLCQKKLHSLETELVRIESSLKAGNPARILDLGYARVFQDGKRKKSRAEISVSSSLKIQMKDGDINATIN